MKIEQIRLEPEDDRRPTVTIPYLNRTTGCGYVDLRMTWIVPGKQFWIGYHELDDTLFVAFVVAPPTWWERIREKVRR